MLASTRDPCLFFKMKNKISPRQLGEHPLPSENLPLHLVLKASFPTPNPPYPTPPRLPLCLLGRQRLSKEAAEAARLRERGRGLAVETKRLAKEAEARQGRLEEARKKGATAEEALRASKVCLFLIQLWSLGETKFSRPATLGTIDSLCSKRQGPM